MSLYGYILREAQSDSAYRFVAATSCWSSVGPYSFHFHATPGTVTGSGLPPQSAQKPDRSPAEAAVLRRVNVVEPAEPEGTEPGLPAPKHRRIPTAEEEGEVPPWRAEPSRAGAEEPPWRAEPSQAGAEEEEQGPSQALPMVSRYVVVRDPGTFVCRVLAAEEERERSLLWLLRARSAACTAHQLPETAFLLGEPFQHAWQSLKVAPTLHPRLDPKLESPTQCLQTKQVSQELTQE